MSENEQPTTKPTRESGVTPEQIEAGWERWRAQFPHWNELGAWAWREQFMEKANFVLPLVVPPGYEIVKRGHWIALTPDTAEAFVASQPKARERRTG